MRMFIPKLGTKLKITVPWEFSLICEERNKTLWDHLSGRTPMGRIPLMHRRGQAVALMLPINTVLTVDRVYLRKGQATYDSVTLKGAITDSRGFRCNCRFWVVLDDFNEMYAEVVND